MQTHPIEELLVVHAGSIRTRHARSRETPTG
jgi:hypothetical protein